MRSGSQAVPLAGPEHRQRPDRHGPGPRARGTGRSAVRGAPSWRRAHPALAERFTEAINRSLTYAQSHPDEMRAMLPANAQNSRLPIWSPVIDRGSRLAASYARKYGVTRVRRTSGSSCRTASRAAWCSRAPSSPACALAPRRTAGHAADGQAVHVRRDRQPAQPELRPQGPASTGARAWEARPQHLDREPPAKDVPVLVGLDAGREEELPRHIAR